MSRQISSRSTLAALKKEAKRWLNSLRAADPEALARLIRANPKAPATPSLRDIQHAVALEHGLTGWTELKNRLTQREPSPEYLDQDETAEMVNLFLESACVDPILANGPAAHARRANAALRILNRYPAIGQANIHAAVVCGDVAEVERLLAERPSVATEAGGPIRKRDNPERESLWTPLLHLCYGRLLTAQAADNAVAVARMLLDRGANPNDYFEVGSPPCRYTALCGVVGEGEDDAPRHPRREELFRLLLDRGAEPFDVQLFYNTSFHGDLLWMLEPLFDAAARAGRTAELSDPEWPMLGMGGLGNGARFLLEVAIKSKSFDLAEWLLKRGASPNPAPSIHSSATLHEQAVRRGCPEIAELLLRYGAFPSAPEPVGGVEEFTAASLRLDRDRVRAILKAHPEYLKSPRPMFAAVENDNLDVVEFLLDLGVSTEVQDENRQRPLHVAAGSDALRVAALLIERGAEIDAVESNWNATPLGIAIYGRKAHMIELLGRASKDVWELVYSGNVERLRELVRANPDIAKIGTSDNTPLMWLPDDEVRAIEVIELLLANGADSSVKNKEGLTAADIARKRGLFEAADRLRYTTRVGPTLRRYEEMADALLDAFRTGTPAAMERHWSLTWHRRRWEGMRTYVLLDLGRRPDTADQRADISIDDARLLVAREHGFESWGALSAYVGSLSSASGLTAAKPVKVFSSNETGGESTAKVDRSWDAVVGLMREHRLDSLQASGEMSDAALNLVSKADHITSLDLSGSKNITDSGLAYLARLPNLRNLDLSGAAITDKGLEALRSLTNLKSISLAWTAVTDAGITALAGCNHLERVNLIGTRTGDGALAALTGKPGLCDLKSGNEVTDSGLPILREFPVFKEWRGGEIHMELTDYAARPNYLLLRGSFTDKGMRSLAGLHGLFALNLDASGLAVTGAGLVPLAALPNLGWLAFDATDDSMANIAALPNLRFLMCQDTAAGDRGFEALSRSRTLQYIWGRRCHNLRSRGFIALSGMPELRSLSVSCKNVDDSGLSALPSFPSLTELMPMDIPDAGYRFIGRCERLTALILMYCRDTTDAATEQITGLRNLRKYFASYNLITDRTADLLSGMESLEEIDFSSCAAVTTQGILALAKLPRLRLLRLGGMPKVSSDVSESFAPTVRIEIGD